MKFFDNYKWEISILLGIILSFSACKPVVDEYLIVPNEPSLKILSITPTQIGEFSPVVIKMEVTDGDGDIGTEDPDEKTLSIKDSRLPEADMYHVQPLSPPNTTVSIKAPLTFEINNVFILGNGNSEQVYFTIKIKDKAGNWSKEVQTATLTVTK